MRNSNLVYYRLCCSSLLVPAVRPMSPAEIGGPGINDSLVKSSVLTTRRDLSRLLKQTRIAHLQASLTFH